MLRVSRFSRPAPRPLPARLSDPGERRRPHHHRESHRTERLYQPGDPVPESGIFEVVHHAGHRAPHDAVMHARDLFPTCDSCGQAVRFRLVRTAPYIFDDEDFAPEP